MKLGAADFITKPFSSEEFGVKVDRLVADRAERAALRRENVALRVENTYLREETQARYGEIVGESRAHAGGLPLDRPRGPQRIHGHDLRRVRHREGARGPRHPRRIAQAGRSVHPGKLRRSYPRACWIPSCSVTRRGRSPERRGSDGAASSWPTAARSSWTRSPRCPTRRRCGCCACSRSGSWSGWAARRRSPWTCASSPRPTPRPDSLRERRRVPGGPVLPPPRGSGDAPAAAGSQGGHPAPGATTSSRSCATRTASPVRAAEPGRAAAPGGV